jgi:hypothetical protein
MKRNILHYSVSVSGAEGKMITLYAGSSLNMAQVTRDNTARLLAITQATAALYYHSCGSLQSWHFNEGEVSK